MEKVIKQYVYLYLVAGMLLGCGGGGDNAAPSVDQGAVNRAPQAQIKAEGNQAYLTGQLLKFDGSASLDPDKDPLTYSWQLLNSQQQVVNLANVTGSKIEFTLSESGSYTLQLQVNDGKLSSEKSSISFNVSAAALSKPPVAVTGPDQQVKVQQLVSLSAAQSEAGQGEITSIRWRLVNKPSASQAVLQQADQLQSWFTPDLAGQYQAELTIGNAAGLQSSRLIGITAHPATVDIAPQGVLALPVNQIAADFVLAVDGSQSVDDSAGLRYLWQVSQSPAGSQYQLQDAELPVARFSAKTAGNYQLSLQLTDASGQQTRLMQTIIVRSTELPPIARLQVTGQAAVGQQVVADAAGSMDPLQQPLQYRWQFVTKPARSAAQLQDADASKTSFRPDIAGQYLLALQLSNGKVQSEWRRVIQVATPPTLRITGPQQATVNQALTLQAQATSADSALRYQWAVLRSPVAVTLAESSSAALQWRPPVAGRYQLQLQVTDSQQLTTATRWDIVVSDNLPAEIVLTGPAEYSGQPGALFTFDASQSRDPEQGRLSFRWTLQTPASSKAVLLQPDTATPAFTADVAGDYLLQLQLTDDAGNISTAQRKISISEPAQLISGTVSGRLVAPDNQPLESEVTLLINGSPAKPDSMGYFSKTVRQHAGEPVKILVRQQRSALLTYQSPVQTQDNFVLQLGTQRLAPELPLSLLTLQGCSPYRGPSRFNLRFTLNELPAGSLFSSDFTLTVPVDLTQGGLTELKLPAGASYQVRVDDAQVLLDHSFGSGRFATSQQYQHPYLPLGSILSTFTFCDR